MWISALIDEEAVKKAMTTQEGFDELGKCVDVSVIEEKVPAKLRINKKKNATNVNTDAVEILDVA